MCWLQRHGVIWLIQILLLAPARLGGDLQPNTDRGALFLRRPFSIKDVSVVLLSRVDSRRACVDIQKEFANQTLFGCHIGCIKR